MSRLTEDAYPKPAYAWYVVVVLTLAYVLSFIDRQILSLLISPIKADLSLSDTQIGLLLGPAFAIFYVTLGVPIGWLADRTSRRNLIGIGIALWSLMTAASGLARGFGQLFAARIGVGVGEATLTPCANSLISDYFPREKAARPIAFYTMAAAIGVGLAFIAGGAVIRWVAGREAVVLPVLGTLATWQATLIVVGLPGLLVALLMLTVAEPQRRGRMTTAALPFREVLKFMLAHRGAYLTLTLGMTVAITMSYALSWTPALFQRTWAWDVPTFSVRYGVLLMIAGPVAINLAGWVVEKLLARGVEDAALRVAWSGAIITVVGSVAAPLQETPEAALALLIVSNMGTGMATASTVGAVVLMSPNELRGQAVAIYLMTISLIGLFLGPTSVAWLTDYVFGDEAALRYSLAIVPLFFGAISMAAYGIGRRAFLRDMRAMEQLMKQPAGV